MRSRTAIVLAAFGLVGLVACDILAPTTTTAENQHREPILIPGVQEPGEMRVEPLPAYVPTAPERMLGEAMERAGNNSGPAALLPALNRILERYPDYSDGYVMRLASLCSGNDRAAILSDINSALRYASNSLAGKDSPGANLAGLLSFRAKVELANGNDTEAMGDLDKAIHADLGDPTSFVQSGATAPEKSASACTLTTADMDALVQRFPADYRAYLFRGLYHGFFVAWDQDSLKPAMENFRRAAAMDSTSALPHYFSAHIMRRAFTLRRLGMTGEQTDDLNRDVLNDLNRALTLDPDILPALRDRAQVYLELKQFQKAVFDYDKILAQNPKDHGAYNDRGLAKMQLGHTYEAISDFGMAIENKKRELSQASSYENRADAYIKTQQWDHAIRDLTTAISLQAGGFVLLMNINQFRALYPEYKAAPDEAIARKLYQTFFPNMKYAYFSTKFLHDNVASGFFDSSVIPDLYLKRSDAYLKAGNWHRAAVEFRRAVNGFPRYAEFIHRWNRWREVGSEQNVRLYIDMKTFDDGRRDSVKLWIKQAQGSSDNGPYSLQQFEMNCGAGRIRTVSFANYDVSGNLIGSREGGKWGSVIPETLGETLFGGICQSN